MMSSCFAGKQVGFFIASNPSITQFHLVVGNGGNLAAMAKFP
jgi:hypothetical protein